MINEAGEEKCLRLDKLIKEYVAKYGLAVQISSDIEEGFPWRHYYHQDFRFITEPWGTDIGITLYKGEDHFDGYCFPPLFALENAEESLTVFNYLVHNSPQYIQKYGKFCYLNDGKFLSSVKNKLKLAIIDIPQRLNFP